MNHKLVFRKYGVRRPLKWRRRMAREQRRLVDTMSKREKQEYGGHHSHWWLMGQDQLWLDSRTEQKGGTDG